jgi:hypothetical protein
LVLSWCTSVQVGADVFHFNFITFLLQFKKVTKKTAAVNLLAEIKSPPTHLCAAPYRQTPQGKINSYNSKYAIRPFVKHAYAFADAARISLRQNL